MTVVRYPGLTTTPLQLSSGTLVGGDFRVIRPLRAGGMGAVYVAEQLSTGKERALKLMHPQLVASAKLRERFVREARVGSLIDSDHVVEVIAAGIESELPWIAMELLEGGDLALQVLDKGTFSAATVLAVMRQLCHALAAAHRAGVVHRDIKPENILLARSRSATTPTSIKVLDFGIARVAEQAKTTATGTVGSPAWMAPEQTDPKARITPATDVWAAGLLCYWLLTGRPFWRTATDGEASLHALMREILFDPIPPASERAALDGVTELPEGFDDWFARCVARDPDDRFVDAGEMFHAFERMLEDAGIDLRAPLPDPVSRALDAGAATSDEPARATGSAPTPITPLSFSRTSAVDPVAPAPKRARARWPWAVTAVLVTIAVVRFGFGGAREIRASLSSVVDPIASAIAALGDGIDTPASAASARVTASTSASPSASASASAVASAALAPHAAPSLAAFNRQSAESKLAAQAAVARTSCAAVAGPRVISVSVTFAGNGSVSSVRVPSAGGGELASAFCVQQHFWSIRVEPFVGPAATLTIVVTLP
jgi:serine/threonine protein kinase